MSPSLKNQAISSMLWKLFEQAGGQIVALIVQIILARLLAPEDYGMLAIIVVFVNIGCLFVRSGMGSALIQAPYADDEDFSTVFWTSFGIAVLIYVLLFFAAPAISLFYSNEGLTWPLRIIALILITNALYSVQIAKATRDLELRKVFFSTLPSVVVSGALGCWLAYGGVGVWALVAQQLASQVIGCIILGIQISWKPCLIFRANRAKELFSFAWKLLVSGLLDVGYQSLSDLIIGKQFSSAELGLVSQGKKYPQAIGNLLDGSIQPVVLSSVAKMQRDPVYVRRLVRRALKTSTFLIVPAMALFALISEPLVKIVLGEQWISCVPFLQMYCFVFALLPIHATNIQAINGMGKSDIVLKLSVIKTICGIAILLIAAFVYRDVYVIVAANLLVGVISAFANALPTKRLMGYGYCEQFRDIVPAFLLSTAAAAVSWPIVLLMLPDVATILLQTTVMVLVYIVLSALFHVEAFRYLWETAKAAVDRRTKAKRQE